MTLCPGPYSISASFEVDGVLGISVASVDLVDGRWYVSRVMVLKDQRGLGVGSDMLQRIIYEIKSRPDAADIIVCPGGYNEDPEKQFAFYKKNGFVDTDTPGMLVYKMS